MNLDTLFLPFDKNLVRWPNDTDRVLFLNARAHPSLSQFKNLTCQQFFAPYANELSISEDKIINDTYRISMVNIPKNRIESEYLIATALNHLEPEGTLITAADNKAGGTRLAKTLKDFGLEHITSESKNKARVVWGIKSSAINNIRIQAAIEAGKPCIKNGFHTQPGIYGWNKIDKGSEILTHHIPENLKGHGADFGCGYGFLARHILEHCPKIRSLTCIDADARALECSKKNLPHEKTAFHWADLTKPTTLKNLDFIIMNPPFHEGKSTDISIGNAFIENAHTALKKHGELYIVANAHLPYEDTLKQTFFKLEKLFEGSGFKIYKATK